MKEIQATRHHKVFLAELQGETLVVSPQGDAAGFRESDVQQEIKTLLSVADDPGIANLVIDFGRDRYFGSIVIGAIYSLGVKVRGGGGRLGLADISDEMLETLRILKLDAIWTMYDSLKSALKEFDA